ncbi:hypothetical protein IWQ56_003246 [Coemansia nantahalensis]|nr:hypothetical protein IWQ56_003246 [Coemansia nantahalensis]
MWAWAVAVPRTAVGLLPHVLDRLGAERATQPRRPLRSQGVQTDDSVSAAYKWELRRQCRRAAAMDAMLPQLLRSFRALPRRLELERASRRHADLARALCEQNAALLADLQQACIAAGEASAAAHLAIQGLASKVDAIDKRLSKAADERPASWPQQAAAVRLAPVSVDLAVASGRMARGTQDGAASEKIGALDALRELDFLPPPAHNGRRSGAFAFAGGVRLQRFGIRRETKRRSWFGRRPA